MADKIDKFLKIIEQIESSGGVDLDHKVMDSGIHEGMAAVGKYGLMPNTVKEVVVRGSASDPELKELKHFSAEDLGNKAKEDAEFERKIAEKLAQKVLNQNQGDEEKAAYGWNMGHNLGPEKIKERGYQEHPYVEKYKRLQQLFKEKK